MNTIWIFGDSYAEIWTWQIPVKNKQWQHTAAEALNYNVHITGLGGSSLYYAYAKFDEVRNDIKENDVVIVCLTDIFRKWFFKEKPNWGNIDVMMHETESLSNGQYKAIKAYYTHLNENDDFIAFLNLKNFLYALHYKTKELNLKTIVMPNFTDTQEFLNTHKDEFPLFRIPNRTLVDLSMKGEFTPEFLRYWTVHRFDRRPAHLIRSNHNIMADKIVRNIQHNEALDFTSEFIEGTVDFNKEHNKEWCDYELFGQDWKWHL